jgi:hypothetical protein
MMMNWDLNFFFFKLSQPEQHMLSGCFLQGYLAGMTKLWKLHLRALVASDHMPVIHKTNTDSNSLGTSLIRGDYEII